MLDEMRANHMQGKEKTQQILPLQVNTTRYKLFYCEISTRKDPLAASFKLVNIS